MSRDKIPLVVLGNDGRPLAGATVTVRNHPAGTTATIYADDTSGATLANPLTTDARGVVAGWVDRGMYAATITAPGFGPLIEYFAAAPAGDGQADRAWLDVDNPLFEVAQTHTIMGQIVVPAGNVDVIPRIWVPIRAGQTTKLARVRYQLDAGGSATFKIQRNGVDVPGLTGLAAVPAGPAETPPTGAPLALASNDWLRPIVTAIAGTPINLSIAYVFELSVAV